MRRVPCHPRPSAILLPTNQWRKLYDCNADPHELKNLADDHHFVAELKRLREAHLDWVKETKDIGLVPEPVIAQLEKEFGSSYAILRQQGGDALAARIARVADLASSGLRAVEALTKSLSDSHPAVRYWAATGLGNIGDKGNFHRADAASVFCR